VPGVETDRGPIALPRAKWLAWRVHTMMQLDAEPREFRCLVHEVNLAEAKEQRRLAAVAETKADQCKHRRWRRTCPHCQWENR
jgi:hypothetical protein